MVTITVPLPDPLGDWVESQARNGGYSDVGDYVRDLIRRDQDRAYRIERMQALVDEGLASGMSERTMETIENDARRDAGLLPTKHAI